MDKIRNYAKLISDGPLDGKAEKVQCAYFLIWVGDREHELSRHLTLQRQTKTKLPYTLKSFEVMLYGKRNQVFLQYVFRKRGQLDTETVDKFITEPKILVKTCSYNNESEMIRGKIVCGVKSTVIHTNLIKNLR